MSGGIWRELTAYSDLHGDPSSHRTFSQGALYIQLQFFCPSMSPSHPRHTHNPSKKKPAQCFSYIIFLSSTPPHPPPSSPSPPLQRYQKNQSSAQQLELHLYSQRQLLPSSTSPPPPPTPSTIHTQAVLSCSAKSSPLPPSLSRRAHSSPFLEPYCHLCTVIPPSPSHNPAHNTSHTSYKKHNIASSDAMKEKKTPPIRMQRNAAQRDKFHKQEQSTTSSGSR